MTDFKNYERKLIQISRNTAVLLHLFHKDKCDALIQEHEENCKKFYKE